jgi:antitoxin component of MazEF toxin-antitoxin module
LPLGRQGDPAGEAEEAMAAEPSSVTFETTVAVTGNNTGIVVPEEAIKQLAAGQRPPVLVNLNGYEYRNTVGVMGGKHMVSISAAVRKATGLQGGDPVHVTLTITSAPREVAIPADFAAALAADEQASAFFGKLSNSMQRYHVDNITAAKSADTRQRRIDKAIALFRAGKQR